MRLFHLLCVSTLLFIVTADSDENCKHCGYAVYTILSAVQKFITHFYKVCTCKENSTCILSGEDLYGKYYIYECN